MAEIYVDRRLAPVNINLHHKIFPSRGQRIFGIISPPYARLFSLVFALAAKSGRQERAIAPFFGAAHVVRESHGGDLC